MPCTAAKPVWEWDLAAAGGCANASQAAARAGQSDNIELGACLTSLGPVVKVVAVLLLPAPLSALDLSFS